MSDPPTFLIGPGCIGNDVKMALLVPLPMMRRSNTKFFSELSSESIFSRGWGSPLIHRERKALNVDVAP